MTMADIKRYPLARHLRGNPTMHVRHLRQGKAVHEGTGLSFFFRPLSAVLSEVPVDDRELPLLFHARTADFQDLAVQASVTYRVTDPAIAGTRLDFSVDPDTGRWRGTPLEQVGGLLTETAQQQVLGLVASSPLASVLADGVAQIRDRILHGLTADARLAETGIAVIGARVVALRPEPEVEKALRTPARSRSSRRPTGPPTSGARWPSSGSARSPRTSCRARSSSPAARSSSSPSAAPTPAARRRTPRPRAGSRQRRRPTRRSSSRGRAPTGRGRSARPRRRARRPASPPTVTSRSPPCSRWRPRTWPAACRRSGRWCSHPTC